MRAWVVRAGKKGENEDFALENNVAVIGWSMAGDLSSTTTKEDIREILQDAYPDRGKYALGNNVGQLLRFVHKIEKGDFIVLPLKTTKTFAIGSCIGNYEYRQDAPQGRRHVRPVNWIRTEIPRHSVKKDLSNTLDSAMTVFEAKRNNAVARLKELASSGSDPGMSAVVADGDETAPYPDSVDEETRVNVDLLAAHRIEAHLAKEFTGHRLAELVEAILRAEGYVTWLSPPGPDGGVDVLAGSGPFGLDKPRIAVQVKSGKNKVGVDLMNNLQGAAVSFGADTALFVAWGGFNREARKLAKSKWFQHRIWDSRDLIDKITENYDKLPDHIQAKLPLKQIWTLALDDE